GASLSVVGPIALRLGVGLGHVLPVFCLAVPAVTLTVIHLGAGVDPYLTATPCGGRSRSRRLASVRVAGSRWRRAGGSTGSGRGGTRHAGSALVRASARPGLSRSLRGILVGHRRAGLLLRVLARMLGNASMAAAGAPSRLCG